MNLRTTTHRIVHGTEHMPAHALILRTAVVLFGTAVTLTNFDALFGILAATITAVAAFVTFWELHDAAVECEQESEDVEDQGETGFGTAA